MSDYDGKVMVITGASAGIGAALADEVVRRGGRVVLAARRPEALAAVAARLGDAARPVPTDVTRRPEVERLLDEAVRAFSRVDVWVNNAGRGISKPVAQLTDDDVDAMVRDNLKSALYGMQTALGHFAARGEGAIVNVSSMLGRMAMAPIRSAYSAAKAGLNSLTESFRADVQARHPKIRVVTVMPGVVATEFGLNAMHGGFDSRALPGAQPVDEVARVIADAALTKNGDVYTHPGAVERVLDYVRNLAR